MARSVAFSVPPVIGKTFTPRTMQRTISALGFVGLSLLLAACQSSVLSSDQEASSSSTTMQESSLSSIGQTSSASQVSSPKAQARVITISAENFDFNPSTITVKKGEKVTLVFQGVEGHHGVMIADLGINVDIPDGGSASVELPTDKTGTFAFRCSVPCGPGHKEMTGAIIIE